MLATREPEAVRLVVMGQPHRRGSDDYRRASAFGRALLDGLIVVPRYDLREAFRAAELFTRALADTRWVLDSRMPLSKPSSRLQRELTAARARKILRYWRRLTAHIGPALTALTFLADEPPEETVVPREIYAAAEIGLAAVAEFYRLPKGGMK
jgi:hypothetical protein